MLATLTVAKTVLVVVPEAVFLCGRTYSSNEHEYDQHNYNNYADHGCNNSFKGS